MVSRVTEAGQSYIACERGLAIRWAMKQWDRSRPNGHYLGLLELLLEQAYDVSFKRYTQEYADLDGGNI